MYGTGLCFADRARGGLSESATTETSLESTVRSGFVSSVASRSVGLGFLGGGGFIDETSVGAEDSSLCEAGLVFGSGPGSRAGFRGGGGFIADDLQIVDETIQNIGRKRSVRRYPVWFKIWIERTGSKL